MPKVGMRIRLSLGQRLPLNTIGGFSAASISDLGFSLLGSRDVNLGADPDVASWNSSDGTVFSEGTAGNRPHLEALDSALNNKPSVQCVASSAQRLLSDSNPLSASDWTVVIVGKRPFVGGEHFSIGQSSGGNRYISFSIDGANKPTAVMYDGGAANETSSHSACDSYGVDTAYIVVATYTRATPSIAFKVNSGAESSHTFTLTGNFDNGAPDRIGIGGRYMNGAFVVNGENDFAEVAGYTRALTTAEKAQWLTHAQAEYGVA